jgi:hypothetical protein
MVHHSVRSVKAKDIPAPLRPLYSPRIPPRTHERSSVLGTNEWRELVRYCRVYQRHGRHRLWRRARCTWPIPLDSVDARGRKAVSGSENGAHPGHQWWGGDSRIHTIFLGCAALLSVLMPSQRQAGGAIGVASDQSGGLALSRSRHLPRHLPVCRRPRRRYERPERCC